MHLLATAPDTKALIIGGAIAVFLIIVIIASSVKANKLVRMYGRDDGPAKAFDVVTFVAVILLAVAVFVGYVIQSETQKNTANALNETRAEWVESHGVTTQSSTVTDLEFPKKAPDKDTQFGVAQVVADDNSIISVHLAWEDDDFVLYGTDGEPLERLAD